MEYNRYFMPLENEAAGYDFKGRNPAGRCIVENRDGAVKVSVWAQDVRAETRYGVYLVFPDNGRFAGVAAGNINIDDKGKAEMKKEIEPSAIGFPLGDLTAVALIDSSNTAAVVSPLCGYRDKPVSWRGNFYIAGEKKEEKKETVHIKKEELKPVMDEKPKKETEKEIVPEPEEVKIIEEPKKKPKSAKPSRRTIAQEFSESLANLNEETLANSPGRTENILAIESIFNSKEAFAPFEKQTRKIKWVKLTISDPVPLPNNRPLLLEESFVRAAYANHGHLILGVTPDGAEYVIGVPGDYAPDIRPHAKRLGFTKFKNSVSSALKPGDHGYWLMFINM